MCLFHRGRFLDNPATVTACLVMPVLLLLAIPTDARSIKDIEESDAKQEAADKAASEQEIRQLLSLPLPDVWKRKKVALVIAERHSDGRLLADQSAYGPLFSEIDARLQKVGFQTIERKELQQRISGKVAAEVMRLHLQGDDEAASRVTGESYCLLTGRIDVRASQNLSVAVNEVHVDMVFTLYDQTGKSVATVTQHGNSYAGTDVLSAALSIARTNGDRIVATLYHEACMASAKK